MLVLHLPRVFVHQGACWLLLLPNDIAATIEEMLACAHSAHHDIALDDNTEMSDFLTSFIPGTSPMASAFES